VRIGVLGGTFNPIHLAHLQMAKAARDALSLDRVLLMVAADPPHKRVAGAVAGEHRLRMVQLAAAGAEGIEASDLELNRNGRSYTFDTLMQLKTLEPNAEFFWIVGSDMLLDLPTWHRAGELLQLASIIAVPRAGQSGNDREAAAYLRETFGATVHLLGSAVDPISSTEVRDRVREGRPVEHLVHPAVSQYFHEKGLYFPPDIDAIRAKLFKALSPRRYRHTMGVVRQAAVLTEQYASEGDVSFSNARLAALLHDCAKQMDVRRLAVLAGDDTENSEPVLHAFAGAVVAKNVYGISDQAVLRAIRLHTTGDSGMGLLDRIVYLADVTEPGRDFAGVDACRESLKDGSAAAMRFMLSRTTDMLLKKNLPIHPASLRAERYFQELTE